MPPGEPEPGVEPLSGVIADGHAEAHLLVSLGQGVGEGGRHRSTPALATVVGMYGDGAENPGRNRIRIW